MIVDIIFALAIRDYFHGNREHKANMRAKKRVWQESLVNKFKVPLEVCEFKNPKKVKQDNETFDGIASIFIFGAAIFVGMLAYHHPIFNFAPFFMATVFLLAYISVIIFINERVRIFISGVLFIPFFLWILGLLVVALLEK